MSVHNTTCCRGIQAIWQCEEYIQHGTVKIKHVLHTPYIQISLHIRKNCELVWREDVKNLQRRGWAVPPIRSVFPDYGPFTDFFEEIGSDLVCIVWEKSDFCRYSCGSWIQLLYQQANRPITWFLFTSKGRSWYHDMVGRGAIKTLS